MVCNHDSTIKIFFKDPGYERSRYRQTLTCTTLYNNKKELQKAVAADRNVRSLTRNLRPFIVGVNNFSS